MVCGVLFIVYGLWPAYRWLNRCHKCDWTPVYIQTGEDTYNTCMIPHAMCRISHVNNIVTHMWQPIVECQTPYTDRHSPIFEGALHNVKHRTFEFECRTPNVGCRVCHINHRVSTRRTSNVEHCKSYANTWRLPKCWMSNVEGRTSKL